MKRLFAVLCLTLLAGCGQREAASEAEPGAVSEPAVKVARQQDPAQIQRGLQIYEQNCAACHGAAGKGLLGDWRLRGPDGKFPPPPLDDSAHAWHHPTAVLKRMIAQGSPGGSGNMPAWQGRLSEGQIDDVVAYIQSLWSDKIYAVWSDIEQRSLQN